MCDFFDFMSALPWIGDVWHDFPFVVATTSRVTTLNSIVTYTSITCPHSYTNLVMSNYL